MAYMMKMLRQAIANYYGDSVPDVATFKNRRRKTFIELLEKDVDAAGWRQKIAEANAFRGTRQGVVTRLQNERQSKLAEQQAAHMQQIAELKAKHEREKAELVAHYEPALLEANSELEEASKAVDNVKRASYFAGLKAEDDGRAAYRSDIESAIRETVDTFIDQNLMSDEEGTAVMKRAHQEAMVSDLAYIAEKLTDLRGAVLAFIQADKLPPLTVEAWLIENGKDLMS